MSGKLYINGNDLTGSTYGLRIGGVRTYQGRSDEMQGYVIPGRIGELLPIKTIDIGGLSYPYYPDGFPNEIREYDAALYLRNASAATVEARFTALRQLLFSPLGGYKRITDSYEPSFFRLGAFSGDFAPERLGAGQNFRIPLTFSCDPRRFFVCQDTRINDTTVQMSPANSGITGIVLEELARPVITVEGNGDPMIITFLTIQSDEEYGRIEMAGFTGTVTVDTNDLTARGAFYVPGDGPLITAVSGTPCLLPTGTKFHRSAGSAVVVVAPRWWVR